MAVSDALMMIARHCDTLNDLVAQFLTQTTLCGPLVDTGRFLRLVALLAFTRDRARGSAIDEPTRTGNHG